MKLVLLVSLLCVLAGAWADSKAGHLSQGSRATAPSPSPSESPLSAIPALAAAVMGAAPTKDAATDTAGRDGAGAGDGTTFVLDVKLNDGEGESGEPTAKASMWSSLLPSFPLFRFGANPTARHLRRPEPVLAEVPPPPPMAMAMGDDGEALHPDAAPAKGGIFGAICGGIMDALFGPVPTPVPLPPPEAPLVTPSGWFNVRPSSFFSSFLGPSPSEAMAADVDANADAAAKPTIITSSTSGPMIFTITSRTSRSSADGEADGAGEGMGMGMGMRMPPSPGAEMEDAGMHRIGGRSRLGKLFNRVMRFLHLRPRFDPATAGAAAAVADDDTPPEDEPEAEPETEDDSDSEDAASDDSTDADADVDASVDADSDAADEQTGGHRWRRWRDHHRRHRGRGRWGLWHRNHRACKRDVRRLCPNAKREGGFMGVVRCMIAHRTELSPDCTQHMSYSRGFNCANDAVQLCPYATSRHQLKRCLEKRRAEVSEECNVAIEAHRAWRHGGSPAATPATPAAPAADDDTTEDATSVKPTPVPAPAPVPVATAPKEVAPKAPVIAIELQTTPNAKPDFEYSGAAKPAPSSPRVIYERPTLSLTARVRHLPTWAAVLLAALAVVSAVGVVACVVVTCRRSRAAAAAAAAKAPRIVVAAPARSAVQFANVAAAPVQPVKSSAASSGAPAVPAAASSLAEPLISVKVAAV